MRGERFHELKPISLTVSEDSQDAVLQYPASQLRSRVFHAVHGSRRRMVAPPAPGAVAPGGAKTAGVPASACTQYERSQ